MGAEFLEVTSRHEMDSYEPDRWPLRVHYFELHAYKSEKLIFRSKSQLMKLTYFLKINICV